MKNELVQEVIAFLLDNEQYGDDWGKHIEALNDLIEQNTHTND